MRTRKSVCPECDVARNIVRLSCFCFSNLLVRGHCNRLFPSWFEPHYENEASSVVSFNYEISFPSCGKQTK